MSMVAPSGESIAVSSPPVSTSMPSQSAAPVLSAPVPPQPPAPFAPSAHPAACPSWCRERHDAAACASLGLMPHLSAEYRVENPAPLDDESAFMLRAQLLQIDRVTGEDTLVMYVSGESDVELEADEADVLIAQMQAFVDTLRVLRRQMG